MKMSADESLILDVSNKYSLLYLKNDSLSTVSFAKMSGEVQKLLQFQCVGKFQ